MIDEPIEREFSAEEIEQKLRDVIGWARSRAAHYRTAAPIEGRAASIIATSCEDALYRLQAPVP